MSPPAGSREFVRAGIVAGVAVLAVLSPLGRTRRQDDSFPLSNYPMFTHNPNDTTGIERAVGLTADGDEVRLSPELSGGTVEVIHAAQTLTNAVRRGEAAELCVEIAGRVAASGLTEVAEVVVTTDRFEIVEGLRSDDPQPVERVVHARCEVPT
jgi:hypothetical protein